MAPGVTTALSLGALLAGARGFVPFANVEELRPRRLKDFCGSEPVPGRASGVRRCEYAMRRTLEDESDIELSWQMEADPDQILSLDTEAEHGVQLKRCGPGELELLLPESHAHHAAEGAVVVGSRFVHNCAHRPDHQLYHRIKSVRAQQWQGAVAHVHLITEELEHISHAVPKLSFYFSWMPSEAKNLEDYPEMKTDYGINREHLRSKQGAPRKLFSMPSLSNLNKMNGVSSDTGGFQHGGAANGDFAMTNGVVNLMPKQLSNFGWNWDFFMNTTQEPDFDLSAPGLMGMMKIRKPYIKVHAGIFLNFSSQFEGLTLAPKVFWRAGIKGHGRVQAKVMGSMNTTGDAGADPFHAFKLPVMQELERPLWFEKVDFATGSLPISMEPGFKCTASMYHHGRFKGAARFGGKTRGWLEPALVYDSVRGFDTQFTGELKDIEVWPPLWLMFTRRFELGVMLKPSLLMRGDFAGLERATMAIEGRPYGNVTVIREGAGSRGSSSGNSLQKLTVYPIRVTGIPVVDFNKKYKVKILANGQTLETTPQVNWGTVEYRDHISLFSAGVIPRAVLMNTSSSKIPVQLVQVNPDATEVALGVGVATCPSVMNGECQPSPTSVAIMNNGQAVATVQMAILWQDNPAPWFSSKIRGLGFSFPQVILREDTLTAAFPNHQAPQPGSQAKQISMHLVHNGQTYVVGLVGTIGTQQSALAGDTMLEFGPGFIDTWKPCAPSAQHCESPRLELYAGATQIATATMPQIDFASQTSMQGTSNSGFMGGSSSEMTIPSTIALSAPGTSGVTIALATMEAKAVMTLQSSLFLWPRSPTVVKLGSTETLKWTVSGVVRAKDYGFTLEAYKLTKAAPMMPKAHANARKVLDRLLLPVAASNQSLQGQCRAQPMPGIPKDMAPCSFEYNFQFGKGFKSGDQIVIRVSWTAGSVVHEMYSPPLEVGTARRLLAVDDTAGIYDIAATPRRLWNQEAWNARIDQRGEGCNRRDMRFDIGAGMLVRGKVDSIDVPKGFPMIGGLDQQPALTTGFRRFNLVDKDSGLAKALGGKDSLPCQMGLCQGYLPGCSKGSDKSLYFPVMTFDHNRPFHFRNNSKGKFGGLMKQALAYAFSTLPESIDIMIKEWNKTGGFNHKKATTTPGPGEWWNMRPSPTPAPTAQGPAPPAAVPAPAPAAKQDSTLTSAFNKWWSGAVNRRLQDVGLITDEGAQGRSSLQVGDRDVMPDELGDNQVRVRFTQGVPFIIDRPLVEMMMQNGYFDDVHEVQDDGVDEHGPLAITRFYVDSGSLDDDVAAEPPVAVAAQRAAWSAAIAAVAVALGMLAVLVLRSKRDGVAGGSLLVDDGAAE